MSGGCYSFLFPPTLFTHHSALASHSALGITAAHFENLMTYVWICGAFNLLPFLFVTLVREVYDTPFIKHESFVCHQIPSQEEIEAGIKRKRTPLGRDSEPDYHSYKGPVQYFTSLPPSVTDSEELKSEFDANNKRSK